MNQQIYEEASEWFTRMRAGEDDVSVRRELMIWLRSSPEHVRAYLDIAAIWMETRSVTADSDLDLATRIALARADTSVPTLDTGTSVRRTRRLAGGWVRAAVAAVVLVTVASAARWAFDPGSWSTRLGEQRTVRLTDGSTLELNSSSKVRVRFTGAERAIDLLQGQALFRVARDPSRPFIVRTDETQVRAVGTVFDVYRKDRNAIVTVVEGTVVVESLAQALPTRPAHTAAAVNLGAGRQITVSQGTSARPRTVNTAAVTAWSQRQLIFEFTPLADVAEEFNRYNSRRIVIEGAALRAFEVSAIFRTTEPDSLVRYLRTLPEVRIDESDDVIRVTAANSRN